jgi:hypothetical protein
LLAGYSTAAVKRISGWRLALHAALPPQKEL